MESSRGTAAVSGSLHTTSTNQPIPTTGSNTTSSSVRQQQQSTLDTSMYASTNQQQTGYYLQQPIHQRTPAASPFTSSGASYAHPFQSQSHPKPHPSPFHQSTNASMNTTLLNATMVAPSPATTPFSLNTHSRLQSLAASLLPRLINLNGENSDPSLSTLQRDPLTQPFMVERLTEILEEAVGRERESIVQQLTADLHQKDAMLQALRNEYQSILKSAALKESLLNERAEILKEELLTARAGDTSRDSLHQSLLPRLQSQITALQEGITKEKTLSGSLSNELKQRDHDLETTLIKYENLSEQFLSLKQITNTLNERILEQAGELELLHRHAAKKAEATTAVEREWQTKYESLKSESSREIADVQRQLHEVQMKFEQVRHEKDRTVVDTAANLTTKEEALKIASEARIKEIQTAASFEVDKLRSELETLQKQTSERNHTLEKAHVQELHYRMEEAQNHRQDLTNKLESATKTIQTLQESLTKLQHDRERDRKELGLGHNEMQNLLSKLREENVRIQATLETKSKELSSIQSKYASTVSQFETTLKDDETKFLHVLESERSKQNELKRRWSEDVQRLKRETKIKEDTIKELESQNAESSRHLKSQADSMVMGAGREEELQKKLHELQMSQQASLAGQQRTVAELQDRTERLQLELREKEKALDKMILERETETKRFQSELEMRLLTQKQAAVLEKLAVEKDMISVRTQMDALRAAHEAALQQQKSKFDEEKLRFQTEQQLLTEKKIMEVKASIPTQELFDAQVKVAVDEHITALNKTYLSPESHAQIMEAKLEALKFEQQREKHTLVSENEMKLLEVQKVYESRLQSTVLELRTKYEAEYTATMSQVKAGCQEYENELEKERSKRATVEEKYETMSKESKELKEQYAAMQTALAQETASRNSVVEQLEQGGRVIEKLKSLLTSERTATEKKLAESARNHTIALERESETTAQVEASARRQKEEAEAVIAKKDQAYQQLQSRLNQTQRALESATRQLIATKALKHRMDGLIAGLKEEHSALQVSIREDMTSLYGTATSGLASMHTVLQNQRRKLQSMESEINTLQTNAAQLTDALHIKEDELTALQERSAEELNAVKEAHLTDLALSRNQHVAAREADIESLNQRIIDLQENHTAQMNKLKQDHEAEMSDQLKHCEDLLRIKEGSTISRIITSNGSTISSDPQPPPLDENSFGRSSFRSSSGKEPQFRPTNFSSPRKQQPDSFFRESFAARSPSPASAPAPERPIHSPTQSLSLSSNNPVAPPTASSGLLQLRASPSPPPAAVPLPVPIPSALTVTGAHHRHSLSSPPRSAALPSSPLRQQQHQRQFSLRTVSEIPTQPSTIASSAAVSAAHSRRSTFSQEGLAAVSNPTVQSLLGDVQIPDTLARGQHSRATSRASIHSQSLHERKESDSRSIRDIPFSTTELAEANPSLPPSPALSAASSGDVRNSAEAKEDLASEANAQRLLQSLVSKVQQAMANTVEEQRQRLNDSLHDATVAAMSNSRMSTSSTSPTTAVTLNASLLNQSSALENLLETSFSPKEYDELVRASQLHQQSKQLTQQFESSSTTR